MLDIINTIINFGKDAATAIVEVLKFIPNFFELVISIINILPTPLNQITQMSITLISAIFIAKIVRGK